MKKTILIALGIILSIILTVTFFGYSSDKTEKYGSGVDKTATEVKVKDIFLRNLQGITVTLEGKIVSQCGSNGCWFVLRDDTGQIFINLAPSNLTLPPRMNMTAKVTGIVNVIEGQFQVFAHGVEVR